MANIFDVDRQNNTIIVGKSDTVITISNIPAEGSDVDKFLVDSSNVIKYRTGAEVLSDIGGSASAHTHDDRYYTETEINAGYQPLNASLTSIAGLTYASDSFIKVTAEDTYAIRTLVETKTDLGLNLVENTAHSTDAHTMAIDGRDVSVDGTKLDGIEALADVTATNETPHATVLVDADFSSAGLMNTDGAGIYSIKVIGTDVQAYDADLTALAALSSTGLVTRTSTTTYAERTIIGTANQVTVSNGDGVSGNPTLSLPQDIHTGAAPTFAGIKQNTSDGSDDQSVYFAGGGAFGNSRGACIVCYGNELGEAPGKLYLIGGNVANGDIILNVENSERGRFRAEGLLVTGEIENLKAKITSIGGYAVKLTNKTGANSVAGELVNAHTSVENAVEQTAVDDTIPIGAFLDSGIADGSEAWVVQGGIVQVLVDGSTTVQIGDWVKVSSNDAGRVESSGNDQPGTNHFREVGHSLEVGGNNELIKIAMHFN